MLLTSFTDTDQGGGGAGAFCSNHTNRPSIGAGLSSSSNPSAHSVAKGDTGGIAAEEPDVCPRDNADTSSLSFPQQSTTSAVNLTAETSAAKLASAQLSTAQTGFSQSAALQTSSAQVSVPQTTSAASAQSASAQSAAVQAGSASQLTSGGPVSAVSTQIAAPSSSIPSIAVGAPILDASNAEMQPYFKELEQYADYWNVLNRINYLSNEDKQRVRYACAFAAKAHTDQLRISGEPYVTHPLAVAHAITHWQMDADAVIAALLHDVMEDSGVKKSVIANTFGNAVAEMVDGLSKLEKVQFSCFKEAQAKNFHKMLMAMARDLRVIMVKLADRYHNLSTMSSLRIDKRRRIAQESLDIYAPIANRLGLHDFYLRIQNLAFSILHPLRARVIDKAIQSAGGHHRASVEEISHTIAKHLLKHGVEARVSGREKSLYSVYCKMRQRQLKFSDIIETHGFRIIVKNDPACYLALGVLHNLYKPLPGRFKDYIALPRANGYKSLHTSLIGPAGMFLGIQIRTEAMDFVAQEGLAAHWMYKGHTAGAELSLKTHRWLNSLLDMQYADAAEFLENIKIDLFPDEVYVFTPKGRIVSLPRGATAIDFAYYVHTAIGHAAIGAMVDRERVPLDRELKSGNVVEIITLNPMQPNPSPIWLRFAKTGRARSRIRHFLRTQHQDAATALGKRLLEQQFNSLGSSLPAVTEARWQHAERLTGVSRHQLLCEIGIGTRLAIVVANVLLGSQARSDSKKSVEFPLVITGSEGLAVSLASCCSPIPGDTIVGWVQNGSGLEVHTSDCPVVRQALHVHDDKSPRINLDWQASPNRMFPVRLQLDVKNLRGLLGRIANIVSAANSNIDDVHTVKSSEPGNAKINLTLEVSGRKHLAHIIRQLRHEQGLFRIARLRGSGK